MRSRAPRGVGECATSAPQATSTTTGAWSDAPAPARSSRSMKAPVTRAARDGRAEHEVDAQAAVALEALPEVVPVGVDLGAGRVRPHHVDVPVVEERLEGRPLGGGHVRGRRELRHVEDVLVERGDVPVADQRGVPALPPGRGLAEPAQPLELVDVVRVADLAAVGHVQRPQPDPAAGRPDRARLGRRGVTERRHVGEADLDVLEAHPADDRHAVPLVRAGRGDLVAQGLQPHQGQLVEAGLGLLQREHVDVVALQERLDTLDP